MNDDKGSPIVLLPILILLLVAGLAAGVGIAIGANDNGDDTVAAAPVTDADFGTCTAMPGPAPSGAASSPAMRTWLQSVRDCVDQELAGIPAYGSTSIEGFSGDVVVVRWKGDVPPIVVTRVSSVSTGASVSFVRSAA